MATPIGKRFSFSELRHQTKHVIDTAMRNPVMIQKHGKDTLVLVRADQYAALLDAVDRTKDAHFVGQLPDPHKDTLIDAFEQHLAKRDSSRAPG
ncbi:type II toxin-antitoxin system Phd/YefM family antitoxin [Roseibium sp.]|uniref:type II toxin-antitoxin system Phd/YefM family antitoxin n=1 Tax=Roseibium sp. TaxID=1936156 RepID=UPI003B503EC3